MTNFNDVSEVGDGGVPGIGHNDPTFWYELIDEKSAAAFVSLKVRTLQSMRQRGGGPDFIKISNRCIRYRRTDLKAYADQRLRSSTSDLGQDKAA